MWHEQICLNDGSRKLEARKKLLPMMSCSQSRWPYAFKDGRLGNVCVPEIDIVFKE
jgi:hypothetical protein